MWELWPSISLKEVTDDGDREKYFLFLNRHDRNDDYLKFTLLDGENSYHVEMTSEEFRHMAEKSRIPLPEFTGLCVSALTCDTPSTDSFGYAVAKTGGNVQLTWKKIVPGESAVKIRLGSLDFRMVHNANEVCNTLQQLSKYIAHKSREMRVLQDEKNDLQATNKQLRDILETEIVKKDQLEREMYTKFVLVLNRKKEKCRHYKAQSGDSKNRGDVHEPSDDDEMEEIQTQKTKRDGGLLFEDSSDDSQPAPTQRVVKQRRTRKAEPESQREQPRPKQKSSLRSAPAIHEADTLELMDDF